MKVIPNHNPEVCKKCIVCGESVNEFLEGKYHENLFYCNKHFPEEGKYVACEFCGEKIPLTIARERDGKMYCESCLPEIIITKKGKRYVNRGIPTRNRRV